MKKKNVKKIVEAIVLAFVTGIVIFLLVWYFGASHPQYDKLARKEVQLPDLSEGLAPQGICILPSGEFCMSGYMPKGMPSRLYILDGENEHFVTLTKNGKALSTHFGGVTCSENYIFVASGAELVRVSTQAVLNAKNGDSVEIVDEFVTGLQNAFCYYENGNVYAGEFYRAGNYETDESHHIDRNDEMNYAFVYVFEGDENAKGGVVSDTPKTVISIREQVQGIAVYDGGIVLSTSYGLPDSKLFFYRNVLQEECIDTISVNGERVPLYRLDGSNLQSVLVAPCMSEEICIANGRVYILFESLANKYKYFVRTRTDSIMSIALSDI